MNNFGLYIDADNVSHKQMNKIVSEFTPDMNFCIKKIFGDWSKTELKKWSKNVNEYGLEPIQCFRQKYRYGNLGVIYDSCINICCIYVVC